MQKIILAVAATCLLSVVFSACNNATESKPAVAAEDLVKRGEYLVTIMGCDDCHSPKRMGPQGPELIPEKRLSGFPGDFATAPLDSNTTKNGWVALWADLTAAVGPWGQTYAANITSDSTGIGTWTEAQFKKAFTEGKYKGLDNSRPLLPPMPWRNYRNMKEEDLKAIFAFLKATKPVKNVVPAPKLNPPPPGM